MTRVHPLDVQEVTQGLASRLTLIAVASRVRVGYPDVTAVAYSNFKEIRKELVQSRPLPSRILPV